MLWLLEVEVLSANKLKRKRAKKKPPGGAVSSRLGGLFQLRAILSTACVREIQK
jgi:hypothetical protein